MKLKAQRTPRLKALRLATAFFFQRKRDDLEGERLPRDERFFKFTHRETEDDENPFNEEGTEQ